MISSRLIATTLALLLALAGPALAEDPLPSWNDGAAKQSIIDFVALVTEEGSSGFVPTAERIAVFDNDGTLWSEKPITVQLQFAADRVRALAPQNPEWNDQEPYASLLRGDLAGGLASGRDAVVEVVMATHAGMTTSEFAQTVQDWIETARHPTTGRPYTEMVYQPMLEVLNYLRANEFKTYLVSGGEMAFIRPWSEAVYGIPPEQVIGTTVKTELEMRDGNPVILRLPEFAFVDRFENKPVAIYSRTGRRPIAAFGNSDNDLMMLQWTTSGERPGLGLLIHHTDAERERAYDRDSPIGQLDEGLEKASEKGWTLVDMKNDWAVVFPAQRQ